MANKEDIARRRERIKELATKLGFRVIACKDFDWSDFPSTLEELELFLETEDEFRTRNTVARNKSLANIEHKNLNMDRLHEGTRHHIQVLEKCLWVESCKNLLIYGEGDSGKTIVAHHLASQVIEKEHKAFCIDMREYIDFLRTFKNKEHPHKKEYVLARKTLNRIDKAKVLIIDDFLYLPIDNEDLRPLYDAIAPFKGKKSVVFVSKKLPEEWLKECRDEYTRETAKTLVEKMLKTDSEILRVKQATR